MSGFTITITNAGRAALINAQNTGTNAFVLSRVGVSTQHVTGNLAALTALPNERKRLDTMAGDVVADDTLHVTIRDESNDAYAMRAFGLYTSTGVLFAVYSQTATIIEKSAAAMLLLAVDAKLVALSTTQVQFGPVGFTLPPASETIAGITEVATDAEADAGNDNWRYITPRLLKRALAALSGFALIGHKHDASDTTSGIFNVGRIPALGMEKITGLANALAGKAATVHSHTMAQITGLIDALADKAALAHQHHADDITQGVLAVARIPALGMEKISGLANALASKAALAHQHHADDIKQGVLAVGRIPALGMEKITGLAVALSNKADAVASLLMRGSLGSVNTPNNTLVPGAYRQATNANAQTADGYPIANDGGTLLVYNPSTDTGLQTYHGRSSGRFWSRPFLAGSFSPWVEHWTSGNFDPSLYATIERISAKGLFTASPSVAPSNDADNIGLNEFESCRTISTTANTPVSNWLQVLGIPYDANNIAQLAMGIQVDGIWARRRNGGVWRPWIKLASTTDVANAIAAIPPAPNATTSVRGLALLATNAQTQAGTDASRSMTPAGLWSFAKSIGPSGYIQIPGTDLIIQWGVNIASMTEGVQHATLPVAFGGGCLVALANARNPSAVVQYDWYMQVHGKWLDRITFYANKANDSSPAMQGFEWMAIGLAKGNPNPAYSTGGGGGGGGGGVVPPDIIP
ncbi:hypothetical protein GCM10009093_21730 [Brevundimonas terrae]|uniref:Putative tail fiber protein gp53-like C-terminal domain-containing protein n=1 Tax=Brevundimonas terrae TaxID=363631 RepID=A0ABN0YGH3_9CAUL|nr:hypothetical protein [Brevundimonas terrae]NIJ26920.1 hypothetical protein [Brevundimonas terrae]